MIVAVAFAANFGSVVFFNPVLGVFVAPLAETFHWTRAQMALAITIGSGAAALAGPAVGWVLDRWGARWVITLASLVMGLCLLALGGVTALWQFYALYSLGRALSQGGTNAASSVTISNWFIRRRASAIAIAAVGQRLGMALIPVLAAVVIELAGWRAGWLVLAAVVLTVGVIPPGVLLRRRPEDMGLRPDGLPPVDDGGQELAPPDDPEWSLRGAVGTRAYWLLGFAVALIMFSAGSINFHQIPHLVDRGLAPTQAALVVTIFSVVAAGGGLAGGEVARRVGARWALAASMAGQAGSILLLTGVSGMASATVYAVWYGLFFGATVTLNQVIYADYFGRRSLGLVRGSFQPVQMAFNAAGPWVAGVWFGRTGSYDAVFRFFALSFLVAAALVALSTYPEAGRERDRGPGPRRARRR